MCLARKREPIRGKLKSLLMPKFEKSLRRFGPIRLLCKHVTNLLKPATNCLCTTYKLGNSLGSALSDPIPLRWTHGGALTQVSNKLPFFCELHCLGRLLSSCSGIQTSDITQTIPIFLPGKSHGQRGLADCSPWDHKTGRQNLVTKGTTGSPHCYYVTVLLVVILSM